MAKSTSEPSSGSSPRDDLPCPWLQVGISGCIDDGNLALTGLLACRKEEILGSPFDHWLSPASRVLYQSLVQPLLRLHGQVSELALSVRTAQGGTLDVLFYASNQSDGSVSVQLVLIRQRRRIESELLRIKRAADQAPGVIFQLERVQAGAWRFPYVSEAIRQLYGSTAEDAARSAEVIFSRWWPQDRRAMMAELERAAVDGAPFRVLVRVGEPEFHASADDTQRWHEIQGKARRQGDGTMLWHGYLTDVSERVALQDATVQRHALEKLAHTRSEFIARVSHELRTPLNGILGFAQLLDSDETAPLAPAQRDRLAVILSSGHHLLGVVNQLLEISRIETGQLRLTLEPVALQPLLTQVMQLVSAAAQERGIRLVQQPCLEADAVWAEPQRLRQVLLNLLSNAVKYNLPGGLVQVSAVGRNGNVILEIADTGKGLSEPQLAELFQPFNRLGAERTSVEGAGLGLVLSKHLIELMGGGITVQSQTGSGSTFGLTLPAAAWETPVPASQSVPSPTDAVEPMASYASTPHASVLYVEDNLVNALLMEALLARRPHITLHLATDARTAMEMVTRVQPTILLIDMNLPDATGVELLQRLRSLPALRHVPAIVVSASAGPEAEHIARLGGFDGYWTKPLDLERTLAELDRLLSLEGSSCV